MTATPSNTTRCVQKVNQPRHIGLTRMVFPGRRLTLWTPFRDNSVSNDIDVVSRATFERESRDRTHHDGGVRQNLCPHPVHRSSTSGPQMRPQHFGFGVRTRGIRRPRATRTDVHANTPQQSLEKERSSPRAPPRIRIPTNKRRPPSLNGMAGALGT